MIIAGIDFSYGSPSIVVYDNTKEFTFENCKFFNLNKTKKVQGIHSNIEINGFADWDTTEERFYGIATWAMDILQHHKVEHVQIEGYAMGASSGLVFQIAENTGLLKHYMWKAGIKFDAIAPTAVKKSFTGKGNAKKEQMIEEFTRRTGVDISQMIGVNSPTTKPVDDLVDSYAILTTSQYLKG